MNRLDSGTLGRTEDPAFYKREAKGGSIRVLRIIEQGKYGSVKQAGEC
jgi:hypothetical protein